MSDPKIQVWHRQSGSNTAQECDAHHRENWSEDEKYRYRKEHGALPPFVEYRCAGGVTFYGQEAIIDGQRRITLHRPGGSAIAPKLWQPEQQEDSVLPGLQLETDADGRIKGSLGDTTASFDPAARYSVMTTLNTDRTLDAAYVPEQLTPRMTRVFRESYYRHTRHPEKGAKVTELENYKRTTGYALRFGIGPYFSSGEERSPGLRNSFNQDVSDTAGAFSGAGVRVAAYLNVCPQGRLPAPPTPYMHLCGSILGFLDPSLEFTTTAMSASSVESHDASTPASVSRTEGGLYLGLGTSVRHLSHVFNTAQTPHYDVWLRFRTPLLAGANFRGENFAAKGSAQPFDFDLTRDLLTPFDEWTIELGAALDLGEVMRLGLEVSLHHEAMGFDKITAGDGFEFAHNGAAIMVLADLWPLWKRTEQRWVTRTDDRVGMVPGFHTALRPPAKPVTIVPTPLPTPRPAPRPAPPRPAPQPATPAPRPRVSPAPAPQPAAPLRLVNLPPKPQMEVAATAYYKQGERISGSAGRQKARGLADEIEQYYATLLAAGFDPGVTVYLISEGHTNSDGPLDPAANQKLNDKLSNGRAAEMLGLVRKELQRRKARGKKVPWNIESVSIGHGKRQLVDASGALISRSGQAEDKTLSRRSVMRITTKRGIYEQAIRTKEARYGGAVDPSRDRSLGVPLVAEIQQRVRKSKARSGLSSVYYNAAQNTLYLIGELPYKNSSEITNRRVRRQVKRALATVRRSKISHLLKQASRQMSVAFVARTNHPAADNDIAAARSTEISKHLHVFGKWPTEGGTPIEEVSYAAVADSNLNAYLGRVRDAKDTRAPAPAGSVQRAASSRSNLRVGSVSTDYYRVTQDSALLNFAARTGAPNEQLHALVNELALKVGTNYRQVHLDLRVPEDGSITANADESVRQLGLQLQEYVPAGTNVTISVSTGSPATLSLIGGRRNFDERADVREALHTQVFTSP